MTKENKKMSLLFIELVPVACPVRVAPLGFNCCCGPPPPPEFGPALLFANGPAAVAEFVWAAAVELEAAVFVAGVAAAEVGGAPSPVAVQVLD